MSHELLVDIGACDMCMALFMSHELLVDIGACDMCMALMPTSVVFLLHTTYS